MNLDLQILHVLNALTNRNHLLDLFFIFLANYLPYVFAVIAALYWFWNDGKMHARKGVLMAFISFVLARGIFTEIIRRIHFRVRPDIAHPIVDMSQKQSEASFPSGHAAAMFSIAAMLFFYNKKLGWWMLAMAAVTGVARVIIGVHFPSDILGGAALGILVAWLLEKFLAAKMDKSTVALSEISDRVFGKGNS